VLVNALVAGHEARDGPLLSHVARAVHQPQRLPARRTSREGESDSRMRQQPPTRQSKYLLHSVLKMVWMVPGMKPSGRCAKAAGEQSTARATQASPATPGAPLRTPIPAQTRQAPRRTPVIRRSVTEPPRGPLDGEFWSPSGSLIARGYHCPPLPSEALERLLIRTKMSRRGGQGDAMRVVQHADDEEDEAESSEDEEEGDNSDEAAVSDGGEEEEEGAAAATVPRRRATQTLLPAGPLAPAAHAAPRAKIKLSFAAAKAAAIAAGGCMVCCQHCADSTLPMLA